MAEGEAGPKAKGGTGKRAAGAGFLAVAVIVAAIIVVLAVRPDYGLPPAGLGNFVNEGAAGEEVAAAFAYVSLDIRYAERAPPRVLRPIRCGVWRGTSMTHRPP